MLITLILADSQSHLSLFDNKVLNSSCDLLNTVLKMKNRWLMGAKWFEVLALFAFVMAWLTVS